MSADWLRDFVVVTPEQRKLPWSGGKDGKWFRCYFCGHKFIAGDEFRAIFTNDGGTEAPVRELPNEIEIVRRVLAWHQQAYARFHNTEGHDVIEADGMAIGWASVELAKLLTAQPEGAPGNGAAAPICAIHNLPMMSDGKGRFVCTGTVETQPQVTREPEFDARATGIEFGELFVGKFTRMLNTQEFTNTPKIVAGLLAQQVEQLLVRAYAAGLSAKGEGCHG